MLHGQAPHDYSFSHLDLSSDVLGDGLAGGYFPQEGDRVTGFTTMVFPPQPYPWSDGDM